MGKRACVCRGVVLEVCRVLTRWTVNIHRPFADTLKSVISGEWAEPIELFLRHLCGPHFSTCA